MNEALERAKNVLDNCFHEETKTACTEIFPELKENEDERIRKELIEQVAYIVPDSTETDADGNTLPSYYKRIKKYRAYLERQKENSKSANSISSDCVSDAKCEDRWHKVEDSLPDSTREVLCKDAIGNYFIGRYYSNEVWEVSMYDDCDKSNEDNPPVVMWIDIPSEKQKEPRNYHKLHEDIVKSDCSKRTMLAVFGEEHQSVEGDNETEAQKAFREGKSAGRKEVFDHPEEYGLQKEQKPAEWSEEDEAALGDLMWCIEQARKSAKNENDMGNIWYAEHWLKNRIKSIRPQPREEIYQAAKHDLAIKFMNYLDENRPKGKMGLTNAECEDINKAFKENDWAKIIRYINKYSWKPSEEQMNCLCAVVDAAIRKHNESASGYEPARVLKSLYEQLKKLM